MLQVRTSDCIKKQLLLGLLFVAIILSAQKQPITDSLIIQDYSYLEKSYYPLEYKEAGIVYLSAYLNKAKLEDNTIEKIRAYHLFADHYDNNYEVATQYIDSAIILATKKKLTGTPYPASLYGKKGYIERADGNFKEALDNYLKQLELLDPKKETQVNFCNYSIGIIKRDYGDLEGAKSILKKNLDYDARKLKKYHEDYLESYLFTLHELARTYRLNKEVDSANILINEGVKKSKNTSVSYLFELNEGIVHYINEDYESSIYKLTTVLPELRNINDRYNFEVYNLIDAYFYLGKSYEALSNNTKKLFYYKKIDSLTEATNYLIPDTKQAYLSLITHYKQMGDNKNQLKYLTKFIEVDSILDTNYKYVNTKLEADYDIPELVKEKEQLINNLKTENVKATKKQGLFLVISLVSLLGLGYFFFRQRQYKKRFKALIEKTDQASHNSKPKSGSKPKQLGVELSEDIIEHIIERLQYFEKNQGYLKANLTLDKLAKSFKTNSKYLSVVLKNTKEKGVSQYINDLRIAYVIKRLKSDTTFRRFTVKAIANDIGFNTDQAFSKAFYKKTGIYPSYFIKEVNKKNNE